MNQQSPSASREPNTSLIRLFPSRLLPFFPLIGLFPDIEPLKSGLPFKASVQDSIHGFDDPNSDSLRA